VDKGLNAGVTQFSPEAHKQLFLRMRSENIAKIVQTSAMLPKFEARNKGK